MAQQRITRQRPRRRPAVVAPTAVRGPGPQRPDHEDVEALLEAIDAALAPAADGDAAAPAADGDAAGGRRADR